MLAPTRLGARCMPLFLIAVITAIMVAYLSTTGNTCRLIGRFCLTSPHPPKLNGGYSVGSTDANDRRARVAKVSMLYGGLQPMYERALRTHHLHNHIHGYPFFIQNESILDGYWTKPAHLQAVVLHELEKPAWERLEWLFWVDADTVVLNYQTPLESFLPPKLDGILADIQILVSEDWNGLNNGVFAVRVNRYAVELFAAVIAFRDFRENAVLTFQDQSAMEMVLQQEKFAKQQVVVPQRWFNAYKSSSNNGAIEDYHVQPGDLLVHFAGVDDRVEAMAEWCELSERRDPEWDKVLANTNLSSEIQQFWEGVQRRRELSADFGD